MKRMIRWLIGCAMVLAIAVSGLCVPVSAAEETASGVQVPAFDIPTGPYESFAQTGIPLDEIRAAFDGASEYTFVDGKLRIKSMGEERLDLSDQDGNSIDLESIDGYYYADITEAEFADGILCSHFGPDGSWHFYYEFSLDKRFIHLLAPDGSDILIYPDEGWGVDYINVSYKAMNGTTAQDTYENGVLVEHSVKHESNGEQISATYTDKGVLEYLSLCIDGEYYDYHDGAWTTVPPVHANATESELSALAPAMIGCEHHLTEANCLTPSYCTVCNRINEASTPHTWVEHEDYSQCTECESKRYQPFELPEISFGGILPKATLAEIELPFAELRECLSRDLDVKYEDGILTVSTFEDAFVSVSVFDEPIYGDSEVTPFRFHVEEDQLADLRIDLSFSCEENVVYVEYDSTGKMLSYLVDVFSEETVDGDDGYLGYIEEDPQLEYVVISYSASCEGVAEYGFKDSYLKGQFCEREVTYEANDDVDTEVEVRYNAKGEILYLEVEEYEDVYYSFEHQAWSYGRNYLSPAPTPKIAEKKTVDELIALCPSGLSFITAPNETPDGTPDGTPDETPDETPETPSESISVITVILYAVAAVATVGAIVGAAFAGYAIGRRKKQG